MEEKEEQGAESCGMDPQVTAEVIDHELGEEVRK